MVGIDIENIERFKNLNQHLLDRVYTKQEIEYCNSFEKSCIHLAGIWCAKEAVVKALSEQQFAVSEIEILHKPSGAPFVNITQKIQDYLNQQQFKNIHISISHTDQIATAIAMIEK